MMARMCSARLSKAAYFKWDTLKQFAGGRTCPLGPIENNTVPTRANFELSNVFQCLVSEIDQDLHLLPRDKGVHSHEGKQAVSLAKSRM